MSQVERLLLLTGVDGDLRYLMHLDQVGKMAVVGLC